MQNQLEKTRHQVLLRPMTEADVPLVAAIDQAAFGEEALEADDFWVPLTIANNFALVAECAGSVVGFMLYQRDKQRGIYLSDIAVSASHRGQGIGTQMIGWLQGKLKELGRSAIVLHVKASNETARRLYQSLGFQQVGTDPGGYTDGQDACVMCYSTGSKGAGMPAVMLPLARTASARKTRP